MQSVVPFFQQGVCLTLHIVYLWQYYICCTRSGNLMPPLYGVLLILYVSVHVTCRAVIAHWSCSSAGLLLACQYLCGTILVTPYTMVWDWQVSRAGSMPFYWPSCSLHFCLLLFSLSLLSFCRLLLWSWGLWTDRVLIALSQHCIANLF